MKNFKLKRLFSLAFIGCLSSLSASTVFAAAGDIISNTATLNFNVGGNPDSAVSPAAVFTEDNLVNFTVVTTDGARVSVSPSATGQVLTFTVTNNGNGAQDFALSALNLVDNFDPDSFAIFVDSGNGGGYDVLDTAVYIDELAVGDVATVYIVSVIPIVTTPLVDGDIADMTLVAEVRAGKLLADPAVDPTDILTIGAVLTNNSGDVYLKDTEQNVFNDPAGDLTALPAVADVIQNGLHSDTSGYVIASAILSVSKSSVVIWDPVNKDTLPKAIRGAFVQYTLTITNTGTASGDLTTLTDTLVANLTLDLDLMNGATVQAATNVVNDAFQIDTTGTARPSKGVTFCDHDTVDGCDFSDPLITITFTTLGATGVEVGYTAGELKPGDSVTIVFNAIIQ